MAKRNNFMDSHATTLVGMVMTSLSKGQFIDERWMDEHQLTPEQLASALEISGAILAHWLIKDFDDRFKILKSGSEGMGKLLLK